MKSKPHLSAIWALLAAALYALSAPAAKLLLKEIPPAMMASLLYLGAGFGMAIIWLIRRKIGTSAKELHLAKNEMPFIIGMILLDIAAPILLMTGLTMTTAENASLLNNFEIAATSLIALLFFRETITKRLWIAIGLITAASILLTFENKNSLSFSWGSLFVILACICWGLENNCTRMLSVKDPVEIVVLKGFGAGGGSLLIALVTQERLRNLLLIIPSLILGFLAFGLSIFFYVYAQRTLGAAKTSVYYAIAPFIGVFFSLLIFRQWPTPLFWVALLVMIVGAYFTATDKKCELAICETYAD